MCKCVCTCVPKTRTYILCVCEICSERILTFMLYDVLCSLSPIHSSSAMLVNQFYVTHTHILCLLCLYNAWFSSLQVDFLKGGKVVATGVVTAGFVVHAILLSFYCVTVTC